MASSKAAGFRKLLRVMFFEKIVNRKTSLYFYPFGKEKKLKAESKRLGELYYIKTVASKKMLLVLPIWLIFIVGTLHKS